MLILVSAWAIRVLRRFTVEFVVSATTNTQRFITLLAKKAVNPELALEEPDHGSAFRQFFRCAQNGRHQHGPCLGSPLATRAPEKPGKMRL